MLIFVDNSIDIMRLTKKEIETIVRIAREIYGWNVEVYLSGIKKGILECVRMMAKLKLALGDRKIDVIGDYEDNPVVKEALLTGIRLV